MKKYTNDSPTFRSELDIVDTSTPDNGDNISLADRQNFDNILVLSKRIGTLNSLSTEAKTSLVAAINEIFTKADGATDEIGTLSSLETEGKSSIVAAVNELLGTIRKDVVRLDSLEKSANILTYHGAGPHNALYRGKLLGEALTAEQSETIRSGKFEDLYIGDFWMIRSVKYRIAAFDYYLNKGDTPTTTHHVVIVPDECAYYAQMHNTALGKHEAGAVNTTAGGYIGSDMYNKGLEFAKNRIKGAFSGHVLKHRIYLTNAVSNGRASSGAWVDSEVDLMCEQMVYGSGIFSPVSDGSNVSANYRVEASQLPLFRHDPSRIRSKVIWWLRDVITASDFAGVDANGNANYYNASYPLGVRPAFCIG